MAEEVKQESHDDFMALSNLACDLNLGKWQGGGVTPLFIPRKKATAILRTALEEARDACAALLEARCKLGLSEHCPCDEATAIRKLTIADLLAEIEADKAGRVK